MKRYQRGVAFLLTLALIIGIMVIAPVSASADPAEDEYSYVTLYKGDSMGYIAYGEDHQPVEVYQVMQGEAPQGVVYDPATRTVTLTDFRRPDLCLSVRSGLGYQYTVNIVGSCELENIGFLSGGTPDFRIEGSGTLTVNAQKRYPQAIRLYAEDYDTASGKKASVSFGANVKLRLFGSQRIAEGVTKENESPYHALNGDVLPVTSEENTYENEIAVEGYYAEPYPKMLGWLVENTADPDGVYAYNEDYSWEASDWVATLTKYTYCEEIDVYLPDESFKPVACDIETQSLPDGFRFVKNAAGENFDLRTLYSSTDSYTEVLTPDGGAYLVKSYIAEDIPTGYSVATTAYSFVESASTDAEGTPYALITGGEYMTFYGAQDTQHEHAQLGGVYTGVTIDDYNLEVGNAIKPAEDDGFVYACNHYYRTNNETGGDEEIYEVTRWTYDEAHNHYFKDEDFESDEMTPEDFAAAYTPIYEDDGETWKVLKNEVEYKRLYQVYMFTDGENNYAGKKYYTESGYTVSAVYTMEALDGFFDEDDNQLYFFEPTEVQDLTALTPVTEKIKSGSYSHRITGTEYYYNTDSAVTDLDAIDIGNVWTYNLISSNPFCEPRYIPFQGEVNPDIEGAYIDDEIWTNTADGSTSSKKNPTALKPGSAYTYTAVIKAEQGYRFADNVAFTYLGAAAPDAQLTLSDDNHTLTVTGLETVTFLLDKPSVASAAVVYGGVKVNVNTVKGAEKYRVFRKETGTGWKKLGDTSAAAYTDKTAVSGTRYWYTVRCISNDGKTFQSAYDTAGKAVTYVAAPVISRFENINTGTKISWKVSKGAKYYRVFVKNGSSWKSLGDTANTYFIAKDRVSGTKYTYSVRAMNANKQFVSAYNTTGWSYTFVAAPALPKLQNTRTGVKISFTKPKGCTKVRIFRRAASGGGWQKLADSTSTAYIDKTAKNKLKYYYTVRCISADGKQFISGYNTTGRLIQCKR